jgi:hypothetical protein
VQLGDSTTASGYRPLSDIDGSGAITSEDLSLIDSHSGQSLPVGTLVGVFNDAPATTGGSAVNIDNAAVDVAISLFDSFQDAETPDSQLRYQIISVSNPSLFDSTSIDMSAGALVLNAAARASGCSKIVVKATDDSGQSVFATFVADVAYANQAPLLDFWVEPEGANTFRVQGFVLDDDDVEGLFVQFWGAFNMRATVQANGWFEFDIILHESDWGVEFGRVADFQGLSSSLDQEFIGVM